MRTLIICLALALPAHLALAQETKTTKNETTTKVETKVPAKAAPASLPTSLPAPAPVDPSVKQPTTAAEALDASKDFVGAIKAKRWWFASAVGIFLLMFVLGVAGLWKKIGTTWAWVAVGVLSLAAGTFAAFDTKGFNWTTFLTYITAGPTIAWLRDWVKDGISKIKAKE